LRHAELRERRPVVAGESPQTGPQLRQVGAHLVPAREVKRSAVDWCGAPVVVLAAIDPANRSELPHSVGVEPTFTGEARAVRAVRVAPEVRLREVAGWN